MPSIKTAQNEQANPCLRGKERHTPHLCMRVTCIHTHINTCNILYKKEEDMYFSPKCGKDELTHQHALLPTQRGLNCHDTHLSYWSPAILFSESSSPAYIQRSEVLCNFAWSNHEFANIPKNLAVTITSFNWRAIFLAPLSQFYKVISSSLTLCLTCHPQLKYGGKLPREKCINSEKI